MPSLSRIPRVLAEASRQEAIPGNRQPHEPVNEPVRPPGFTSPPTMQHGKEVTESDTIERYACKVCGNWRGGGIGGEDETCNDHWQDVTPRIPLRFVLDAPSRAQVAALRGAARV